MVAAFEQLHRASERQQPSFRRHSLWSQHPEQTQPPAEEMSLDTVKPTMIMCHHSWVTTEGAKRLFSVNIYCLHCSSLIKPLRHLGSPVRGYRVQSDDAGTPQWGTKEQCVQLGRLKARLLLQFCSQRQLRTASAVKLQAISATSPICVKQSKVRSKL